MDPQAEQLIARLRANPDDLDAFHALKAHYQRVGDAPSLINLLEGWAKRSPDGPASATALHEAAELALESVGDAGRAQTLLEKALERDPMHADAARRLADMLEQAGDTRRLLEHLQRRAATLARSGDALQLAEVEHRLGPLYEHQFARPDRAIAHYRKAFEADPSLVPAIYAAREIYRNAGNLKAAATLFELEIKAEPSPERRVALLRELAHVRAQDLHDLHGAIDALGRALEAAPTDLAVMHELASFLLQRAEQRGDGPASAQERQRAADLMYQLAQSTPPDHAMAYCESALDAQPAHDGALELLERLADEHGRDDLLPLRWVGYLQAAPDAPKANDRRKRLGFAYLEAGQPEDAIICLEPLLEAGDAASAEALVDLYRERGRDADATRALGVAVAGLPPERRLPRLREIVDSLVAQGEVDAAMSRAREILALEPGDAEAMGFLEQELRAREDHAGLRDLFLEASRAPGATVEEKTARLRQVAELSEGPLEDAEGAIGAWRAVAALDPTNAPAQDALARLLREAGRWDELVQVLDRKALTVTDPDAKADLLFDLATLHREHRGDHAAAVGALHALRQLRPDDTRARDLLCDVLLETEDVPQAVPLLEERIGDAPSREERVRLLALLAHTYEEQLLDDERAFATSARLLDEEPSDLDALDRMERIDARGENFSRLLETLSYRAEVVPQEERPAILMRIADLADRQLGDLDRAADYYQRALDLEPASVEVLDALVNVYDRAERYRDLVVLLRERAKMEQEPRARAELYRRIARTLADRVQNDDAAAEAWEKVLEAGEDEEALRALKVHAELAGETEALEGWVARLIEVVADDQERCDLVLERAGLLEALDRVPEAAAAIRDVALALEPEHLGAMQQLARYCEQLGDEAGLADALERQLALLEDPGLRLPLARRLADLYEGSLADPARAVDALYAWVEADPTDDAPRSRLVPLLEAAGRHAELVDALDGLAALQGDREEARRLVRRAAEVASSALGDVDGAWARLEPLVDEDEEADQQLRALADAHGRQAALAELFVRLAKTSGGPEGQRRRWTDAARLYEGALGDPQKGLEAMLRAYATDLASEEMLAEVDRLAARAGAWARLAQVYERLLRTVETAKAKRKLLLRHAGLLDEAGMASEALDRVLRASALVPEDDDVLARAEELAPRAGRADELLIVYERRKAKAADDAGRVDALLRAARLGDEGLRDRDRAFGYVAQAVALTVRSPELTPVVEDAVQAMDERRPELGADDARRTLVRVYRGLADDAEDDPRGGAELLLRAARMLEEDLGEAREAFEVTKTAASYAALPHVLDALEALAARIGGEEALDAHFAKLVDDALDSNTAAELLWRRGRLLEETLRRYDAAADVYGRLVRVRKGDVEAEDRYLGCLRKAGKHQDLLVALDRQIGRADSDARKADLLREVAAVWERELSNKWEAIDAWKKVLALFPDDAEASEAVKRLGASTRRLTADELARLDESQEAPLDEVTDPGEEPAASTGGEVIFGDETPQTPVFGDETPESAAFADETTNAPDGLSPVDSALAEGGNPFADDEAGVTAPAMPSADAEGIFDRSSEDPYPAEAHTHVETDTSLDDEFPSVETPAELEPAEAALGLAYDETQPAGAAELADEADVVPVDDDEVEPVPVRGEGPAEAREPMPAGSMPHEPVSHEPVSHEPVPHEPVPLDGPDPFGGDADPFGGSEYAAGGSHAPFGEVEALATGDLQMVEGGPAHAPLGDVEALATGDVELLDEEPLQVGSGEVEELDAELLDGAEMLEDAELLEDDALEEIDADDLLEEAPAPRPTSMPPPPPAGTSMPPPPPSMPPPPPGTPRED